MNDIVVVDNGQTYVSEETAIVATEAAAEAKQWAEEAERQANIATSKADDAISAKDDAVAAKEYAEAAITDTNLITVATDLSSTPSNIKTVATNISDVSAVGNNINNINAVANNATNINAVNANKTNIDKVAGDINRVKLVADDIESVHTVAVDINNVIDVASDLSNINAVAADLTNIDNASTYANNAQKWAEGADGEVSPLGGTHSAKGWAEIAEAAASGVQNPANRDLSNLTKSGEYRFNTINDTISNCILEIPQDINLTLENGTLTLKAGSKIYKPNGSGIFDEIVTTVDKTMTHSTNGTYIIVASDTGGSLTLGKIDYAASGSSAPANPHSGTIWYDTTNNICNRWTGTAWQVKTFPFAIITVSNGAISSIDKVFNGAGYVGHYAFVLPNVKSLVARGKENGKLKSSLYTTTGVSVVELTTTPYASVYERAILIGNNTGNQAYGGDVETFDELKTVNTLTQYCIEDNYRYKYNSSTQKFNVDARTILVKYGYDGTNVTRFDIVKPFNLMDKQNVDVYEYGAKGDGQTDDTKAIKDAIDSTGDNGTVYFPKGEYLISSRIDITKPVNIVGDGAIIKCTIPDTSDNAMFNFPLKEEVKTTTLIQDVSKNDLYIKASDTTGISIGDYISLENGEYWDGIEGVSGFRIETKGELNQVKYISGNDIYLTIPAQDNYDNTNYPVTLKVFKHYEDISVKGITFIGTGGGNSHTGDNPTGGRAIAVTHCSRINITNCLFINFPRFAIQMSKCMDVVVDANRFIGVEPSDTTNSAITRSQWFTGCNFVSCLNVTCCGNTGSYLRRPFDFDNANIICRNISMVGNVSVSCHNAIGTHGCENVTISGNTGIGCDSGIAFRGKNISITGNKMQATNGYAIRLGGYTTQQDYSDTDSPSVGDVVISGNCCESYTDGLNLNVDVDNLIIDGNTFNGFQTNGVFITGRRVGSAKISNNTFAGSGTSRGIVFNNKAIDAMIYASNIQILNNTVENCEIGVLVAGSSASSKTENLMVNNNVLTNCSVQGVRLGGDGNTIISGYFGDKSMIANNIINATTAISIETANFDTVPTQSNNI